MPILFCAVAYTAVIPWHTDKSEVFRRSKESWIRTYLSTGNVLKANSVSGYPIYPNPSDGEFERKIGWLREHHYSLFRKWR
jgi:hypothetical protein